MGNRSKQGSIQRREEKPSKTLMGSSHTVVYSGPIPPASEMKKYEAIQPGSASRILDMTENQLKHRSQIEYTAVRMASLRSLLGIIFAAVIALASLALAGFCIYCDHEMIGTLFGTGGIGSIVATFIYGTRSNRQEREAKWEKALQAQNEYSHH